MAFQIFKEVAALPSPGNLEPDAVYAVRVGAGFDFYITTGDGVPILVNAPVDQALTQRVTALEAAMPDPGASAGTLTNPPLGARLGPMYSPSARPFVNQFKNCSAWEADGINMNWDALVSGGYITPGGQLVSVAPGSNGFYTRLFDRAPFETGMSGRWRLRWTGTATFDFYGAASLNETVPNEVTFDFTADGESWVTLVNRTIDPAGGNIRNFSLVHEDDWEAFDQGQIFRDQFLNEVRNQRVLRFDEWVGILRSEQEGGLRITTWESRGLPTDEIFYRFIPYEWMAELCNLVGSDMWLCLPTASTEDHQQQAAELIQTLMPAPRHVYVELSTKTWDFAGTPQAHYFADNGRIAFNSNTGQEFRNYYALCATRMAQIWRGVWGSDERLHTVVQHQADVINAEVDILEAPMWLERDGTLGLPPYVPPHTVIDMLTVHAQIDGGMAYGGATAQIDTWRTTLTQSEAFDRMRDQMLTAQYFGNTDEGNRNVANLTGKWQGFKESADFYGMEIGVYEVGNHLNGIGGSAETIAFVHAFSVSSQMGEVYAATFSALRTLGFDGPLCFSVECRLPDQNTSHGLQRWLGDHNPAWSAVEAIQQLNDGPSGRGATDFVGLYEQTGGSGTVDLQPILTRLDDLEDADVSIAARLEELETAPAPQFRTVNGQTITGTGNIVTAVSFATDAEAAAYSAANPGVAVFSTQAS